MTNKSDKESKTEKKSNFPGNQEILYVVEAIKYWEISEQELKEKKLYPLIPIKLFSLRKDLEKYKNDKEKLMELSNKVRDLAQKLALESKDILDKDEILMEDFHKILVAIQNLIEYLSRNYLIDGKLEEDVIRMTKSLYDPEVEKKGIEKGIESVAMKMLQKGKDIDLILDVTGLSIEKIEKLRENKNLIRLNSKYDISEMVELFLD